MIGMDTDIEVGSSGINISDVIEVIKTDLDPTLMASGRDRGMGENMPYIKILEQPAPKALRFRYECEGRSAGSIPGANSTPETKTFPTIQIVGYKGRAIVVVSCVTKDLPYRPHPHNLVGREGCKKGVCTLEVNNETMTLSFANLGIQCVKKKDIEDALKVREKIRVDPFRTGFSHRTQPGSIDLNAVRLCFQTFIEGPEPGKFTIQLIPVVSEPVYDKKAMSDLVICKLSDCSSCVAGGREIILLCEKVSKEDISVRLYEERDGKLFWEGFGDFTPTQVHKQVAIAFRTPKYWDLKVENPVQVFIQLRRPSDGATSDSLPFQLTPVRGRPAFWSLHQTIGNKADYRTFTSILQADTRLLTRPKMPVVITLDSVGEEQSITKDKAVIQEDSNNNNPNTVIAQPEVPKMNDEYSMLKKTKDGVVMEAVNDSTANPSVLAESTQIEMLPLELSQSVDQKLNDTIELSDEMEQGFNELMDQVNDLDEMINVDDTCGIYTSLQMAMKNPCEFIDYSNQTCGYEDVIPPRPSSPKPKLHFPEKKPVNHNTISSSNNIINDDSVPPLPPKRAKKAPPPTKTLPPLPEGKKLNIFQKLFSSSKRKEKSRKGSFSSVDSKKSIKEEKSVPDTTTDDVILTEAEHYALYTSFAPHATASEFDEMSFYYSPVEGQTDNNSIVPIK